MNKQFVTYEIALKLKNNEKSKCLKKLEYTK